MITKRQAYLATVLYADIFDYPLTRNEVVYWSAFYKNLGTQVVYSQRKTLTVQRKKRAQWAKKKWAIAKRVTQILRFIPTIELVGVTGGLAMENAKKEDDIDFFFIVTPGTIWISRLLATLIVELLGKRRRRGDASVKDAVCLNMFMSSDALSLPKKEQDFYAAHEVLQLRPLWEKEGTYQKFLQENAWVAKFLPNAWHAKIQHREHQEAKRMGWGLQFVEPFARAVQLWYMKRHRTSEVVSDSLLRFHPKDARAWVKEALAVQLKPHKIPLDKAWRGR